MSDKLARLAALSDVVRARILGVLSVEELAVGELARVLQLPQSTVSRHLKALADVGWISQRTAGASSPVRLADLDDDAARLFDIVRGALAGQPQHDEDLARLASVVAARPVDSRAFFGRAYAEWDAMRRELFGTGFFLPTLLALLDERWVVADLGCGTGEAVAALATRVARVVGVDREPAMLAAARERVNGAPGVELLLGELTDLPLPTASIDVATLMLALHHLQEPEAALREAARVLRPGGKLVLLDMLAHNRAEYRVTMGHVHLGFAPDRVASMAEAAGFELLSVEPLPADPDAQGPPLFLAALRTHAM